MAARPASIAVTASAGSRGVERAFLEVGAPDWLSDQCEIFPWSQYCRSASLRLSCHAAVRSPILESTRATLRLVEFGRFSERGVMAFAHRIGEGPLLSHAP